MTLLFGIFDKIKIWLAVSGAVIVAVGVAFLKGKSAGKAAEEARAAKARIESIKVAKEVTDEVSNLSSSDVDKQLNQWMRDKPKR